MDPARPPSMLARLVLVGWLVVAVIFAAEDVSPLQPLASWLAPLRRGAGLSQSWAMFAPNPARATSWLEVEGRTEGTWQRLDQAGTAPMDGAHQWRYLRASKFTRGLLAKNAKRDREHLARWWCRHDAHLQSVRFFHARVRSGPPGTPVPSGPVERLPLGMHRCR